MKTQITISLVALSLLACQPPKKEDSSLGPEVPLSHVQKAVSDPMAGLSPLDMKVGDGVLIHNQIFVASNPMTVTSTEETLLFYRENHEDYDRMDVKQVTTTFKDGKVDRTVRKHDKFNFSTKPQTPQKEEEPRQPAGPTCYNLSVVNALIPVPEGARTRPNCNDVPNCALEAVVVSVDKVISEGGKQDVIHMEWVMSRQVPYLAAILNQCSSMLTQVEQGENKMPVYVKVCSAVTDFVFGTGQTATKQSIPDVFDPLLGPLDSLFELGLKWQDIDPLSKAQTALNFTDHSNAIKKLLSPSL